VILLALACEEVLFRAANQTVGASDGPVADQTNSYSSSLVITFVLVIIVFHADEGNCMSGVGISVGMVDHGKAAPSPCK
jgi:hypothetical protein